MKTKLLFALAASFLSLTAFSQKKKTQEKTQTKPEEMAVYAEKKGNDYYLVRLEKDKNVPNVYVYSNGETKRYKNYTDLKDVVMEFPGMLQANNSTKEELISILKKDNHFYEITSQRKDPKNFEKTTITVYEIMGGQRRIVEDYDSIIQVMASPYKEAIVIN
ncbi:hypothetical protein H3Z85_17520 [Chryseobacterium indologenes]|uniref:hypothetical protein n=1 Tax=Chryseobacterium indologenes TaxID=253 RepID=UPI0003E08689|nr:hypothetical protein [Chryseobacterium indologenes]ASE60902.1 hypothetical protein CEQ15_05015 [Chryseobacterium indologenes]ATN05011.1 hypothetical protein CRN76_06155 [Chryseobacterium indologenes]AYY86237.1 hypothetical protein EGX91_17595 [Chryseobacterium indologenes]QIX83139.1 hypothetical protein FOB56_18630 [Chryseobacterium indologenes]QPQ51125.1 hypothetical protein H3Z85_17520 [Chryseobacterium indologenes]